MIESCLRPEMVAEITLQPVRRHHVDAAIFFSDIMIPLTLAGVDLTIEAGIGPVIANPVKSAADVDALVAREAGDHAPITQAISLIVGDLPQEIPLIGFAGAPFTLAAYLVEGRPSRDHLGARTMMHADPQSWSKLLSWCADISTTFLKNQVDAGARAVQLFDSWAGSLGYEDYVRHVAPYSAQVLGALAGHGVPRIHFGTGTSEILMPMRDAGADVIGVDYRLGLDEANRRLGGNTPLQGNINPAFLDAPWEVLEAHVRDVVERGRQAPAHVVNLGHGVPPHTDPATLTRIVELVHEL
ncbi:ribose 5-phosphate isomerase [Platysternon megacephalum]|uniref:Uroporphyrinogen decarboxylase n=1 Tax=Platysternon megacephalum TaxID=55544 RepID=A0A4D9DIP8_9SAUR|nr:ribose 5-phosphate isomerase [Platysternon megacephalum]